MRNHYTVIDETLWKRAQHCAIFKNSVEPSYCVTVELDITNFLEQIRKEQYSFTIAMIYAVTFCASQIEEFRYRFVDEKVVLFDGIDTSFTYLNEQTELFKVVNAPMRSSLAAFVTEATKIAREQKDYFISPPGTDIYQFSPMPWLAYTHVSHTNSGRNHNGVPLFDWGKYLEKDGHVKMPFSIQVHHSFVDGIHVAKLVDRLQEFLNTYKK